MINNFGKAHDAGKRPAVLTDTSGVRNVPAADSILKRGARDGAQVVAERVVREIGAYRDRRDA